MTNAIALAPRARSALRSVRLSAHAEVSRLTAYSVEQLEELLDVALTVDSLAEFVYSLPG